MEKQTLDITTTATLRPQVLNETLRSFREFLFLDSMDYQHILNIDPIGEHVPPYDMVVVAQSHFDKVLYRCAPVPNFAIALRWCWSQVTSEYFFNLEDDWQMQYSLDLTDMVRIMEENKDLAILRLNMFESRDTTCRQWNRHMPWNGEFFEIPPEYKGQLAYSGNPSLIRTSFIKPVLSWIREDWCPEKTLKGFVPGMRSYLHNFRFGVYAPPVSQRSVKDIGREWRKDKRFYKHRGYSFTTWEALPQNFETEKAYYEFLRKKGRE